MLGRVVSILSGPIMQKQIQPGSIVVFRNPNPDELDRAGKQVPMRVLEVNGDRAKVEAIVELEIRPTSVYLLTDLVLEKSGEGVIPPLD